MKTRLTFIISFLFVAFCGYSQQAKNSIYLFDEYQEALVVYKDHRIFKVPVNYNLAANHYQFIDSQDGVEKEFADLDLISVIKIGNRDFLPTSGKATEIVQVDPKFYVSYVGNARQGGKPLPYGGVTETASVDSYSGESFTNREQTGSRVVKGINKEYEVEIGKKSKRFFNEKTFLKLFHKSKRNVLKEYIEAQKIDFGSPEQVFKLYTYAINECM